MIAVQVWLCLLYATIAWRPDRRRTTPAEIWLPLALSMAPTATRDLAHFRSLEPAEHVDSGMCLSQREQEVLTLIGRGYNNKENGYQLGISPGTAKKHVENILGKLQVRTPAEATRWLGAIRPPPESPR